MTCGCESQWTLSVASVSFFRNVCLFSISSKEDPFTSDLLLLLRSNFLYKSNYIENLIEDIQRSKQI